MTEVNIRLGDKVTKTIIGATMSVEFTRTIGGWRLKDGSVVSSISEEIKRMETEYYQSREKRRSEF